MDNDQIHLYLHCSECIKDMPNGVSPSEYTALEVGVNEEGARLIVACKRHKRLVGVFALKTPLSEVMPLKCQCEFCIQGGKHDA